MADPSDRPPANNERSQASPSVSNQSPSSTSTAPLVANNGAATTAVTNILTRSHSIANRDHEFQPTVPVPYRYPLFTPIFGLEFFIFGFVRTNGKQPIGRDWGKNPLTYEQVKNAYSFGVIIAPDTVVIDIDSTPEWISKTLELIRYERAPCLVIQTTKGLHLYFKNIQGIFTNNSTGRYLAIGVGPVDFRLGSQGKQAQCILKLNGVMRQCVYNAADYGIPYGDPPAWLRPLKQRATVPNFLGMVEGQGRNSAMQGYCSTLAAAGLDVITGQAVCRLINDHVLGNPLSAEELASCTRDDRFNCGFNSFNRAKGGKAKTRNAAIGAGTDKDLAQDVKRRVTKLLANPEFMAFAQWCGYTQEQVARDKFKLDYEDLGDYLLQRKHIKLMDGENGLLKCYCDHGEYEGIYLPTVLEETRPIVKGLGISVVQRENLRLYLQDLKATVMHPTEQAAEGMVAFKNGVYDFDTDRLMPFNPDIVLCNKIPHNYDPNAYSPFLEQCLTDWANGNPQVRQLLLELAGYLFYRSNKQRKGFILYSPNPRNGKSTYIELIENMLGKKNYCSVGLQEITARFKLAKLDGKLACIKDELPNTFMGKSELIKSLITGEEQNAEFKGKDVFDFKPYAKFLFSTNALPRFNDTGGALQDRLIIVPFSKNFQTSETFNQRFKKELPSMCSALIAAGIRAFRGLLQRNKADANLGFTIPVESKRLGEEYNKENNTALLFFDELGEDKVEQERALTQSSIKQQYADYCKFCAMSNFSPMQITAFSMQVHCHFPNLVTKRQRFNGKPDKCFAQQVPT